jgi:hypothetical protein
MSWLVIILISFIYASLVEYGAHRWVMHMPGFGKIHIWEEHSVQHHAKKRNDINIALSAFTVLLAASPLFGFYFILGWPWVAIVLLGCVLYAGLWTSLHASYHKVGGKWALNLPFYSIWKHHHLAHHKHPRINFGTIFIYTDIIFRTKI